ncbi:MAG: hypothetical protein WDO19_02810 [Bacteroidota bacterium]
METPIDEEMMKNVKMQLTPELIELLKRTGHGPRSESKDAQ